MLDLFVLSHSTSLNLYRILFPLYSSRIFSFPNLRLSSLFLSLCLLIHLAFSLNPPFSVFHFLSFNHAKCLRTLYFPLSPLLLPYSSFFRLIQSLPLPHDFSTSLPHFFLSLSLSLSISRSFSGYPLTHFIDRSISIALSFHRQSKFLSLQSK